MKKTDVVVVGAGPAGCATSIYLSKMGIDHYLLEKDTFPRDKICGDALSGKVLDFFRKTNPSWISEIQNFGQLFLPSNGVIFGAPNGKELKVPFRVENSTKKHAPGFIAKRFDFDAFLASKVKDNLIENTKVLASKRVKNGWEIQTNRFQFSSKLMVSSVGAQSAWARKTHDFAVEKKHYCAGIRAYYKNVSRLDTKGFIELHFVKDILPGYFWIFPMTNGYANVGLGMLSSHVSNKKINLKQKLFEVLELPKFRDRFKDASLEGNVLGWGLPLGSKRRSLSLDGMLLTGDAASLIDPFTGEGIGNALNSGMIAARCIQQSLHANDFSVSFFYKNYDKKVYDKFWSELRLSSIMQKLVKYPWLFNLVVEKANKNSTLKHTITCMFEDIDMRAQLKSLKFYWKLIRN
ncbi:MAG: geranylgeranyl reductase family protein [Bacteroidota bacterium]|nr:geranylgeranyl reductase family protein [Bacteroidota bacterium]